MQVAAGLFGLVGNTISILVLSSADMRSSFNYLLGNYGNSYFNFKGTVPQELLSLDLYIRQLILYNTTNWSNIFTK
jgi:hypothetical protein